MNLSDIKKVSRGGYVCFFVYDIDSDDPMSLVLSTGVADDEGRLLTVAKDRLDEWVIENADK